VLTRIFLAEIERLLLAAAGKNRRIGPVGDIGLEPMTPSLSSWCSNQLS
jgi:hypothetical protein